MSHIITALVAFALGFGTAKFWYSSIIYFGKKEMAKLEAKFGKQP